MTTPRVGTGKLYALNIDPDRWGRGGWTPDGTERQADVLGASVNEIRYRRAP